MNDRARPPARRRISIDIPEKADIYYNLPDIYILTTEDKVRLCLSDYLARVRKRSDLAAPLGIILMTLGMFVTTDFRDFLSVPAYIWQALFFIMGLVGVVWLGKVLWAMRGSPTIEDIVVELKGQPATKTPQTQELEAETQFAPLPYDFTEYFAEAEQKDPPLLGSEITVHEKATCEQQSKRAIFEHPPADPNKSSTLTYNLMVPPGTSPLKLAGFIGILTERPSPGGTIISERNPNNSVLFEILINGKSGYRKQKYTSKWEEFSISVSRSESLNICFTTNCLGNNEWNWAAWGEPRLVEAKPTSSAAG